MPGSGHSWFRVFFPDDSTGLYELTPLTLFLPFPFGLHLPLLSVYSLSLHVSLIQGLEGAGQNPVWVENLLASAIPPDTIPCLSPRLFFLILT